MFYNFIDGPLLIRQIMEYFKWPKVSLMGHSMGAMKSYAYATYLPDTVDFLICLDGLFPIVMSGYTERNGQLIERYIKYSNFNATGKEPPSYTFEEMEKKLYDGTKKSIDINNCKYILNRNVAPSKVNPGKYYFSMDQRLKAGPHFVGVPNMFPDDISRLSCPLFALIPDRSPFYKPKFQKHFESLLKQLESRSSTEIHMVKGTHHIHLNEPHKVETLLTSFLSKYDTSDRTVGGILNEIVLPG